MDEMKYFYGLWVILDLKKHKKLWKGPLFQDFKSSL